MLLTPYGVSCQASYPEESHSPNASELFARTALLHYLKDPNTIAMEIYGIFLVMGNAGFISGEDPQLKLALRPFEQLPDSVLPSRPSLKPAKNSSETPAANAIKPSTRALEP